jgi:hypothetical protein
MAIIISLYNPFAEDDLSIFLEKKQKIKNTRQV